MAKHWRTRKKANVESEEVEGSISPPTEAALRKKANEERQVAKDREALHQEEQAPATCVPPASPRIDVQTAVEMNDAVQQRWADMDWGIACAAVSDFRPAQTSAEKWHRGDMPEAVELVENPDILAGMGKDKSNHQTLVGFALESDDGLASAQGKMARKNLDAIVLNSLKDDGAGFGHDTNKVSVHFRDGKSVSFELKSKYEVAEDLVELWRTTLNT